MAVPIRLSIMVKIGDEPATQILNASTEAITQDESQEFVINTLRELASEIAIARKQNSGVG